MAASPQRAALSKLLHHPWVQRGLIVAAGLVALGIGLGLSSEPVPQAIRGCEDMAGKENPGYEALLGRDGCR